MSTSVTRLHLVADALPVTGITGTAVALLAAARLPQATVTSSDNATAQAANVQRRSSTKGWSTRLKATQIVLVQPAQWRSFLQHDRDVLTETWTLALPLR